VNKKLSEYKLVFGPPTQTIFSTENKRLI